MPSFLSQSFSSYFKRILQFGHAGNNGTPTATTNIQGGDGVATALNLSDDVVQVKPQNGDSVSAMTCQNSGGSNILAVDTTNSVVKAGASQVNTLTLFKEMGLHKFSPNGAGYHYPLQANTMYSNVAYDNDWGNGTDPPTSLDVSGLTDADDAVAIYWYLDNNITLDSVRFIAKAAGTSELNFHLFAYDIDTSSNYGDLSNGVVHANGTTTVIAANIKTGTFTLDTADIDANKVVIGFAENSAQTHDFSCSFNIKYHIR